MPPGQHFLSPLTTESEKREGGQARPRDRSPHPRLFISYFQSSTGLIIPCVFSPSGHLSDDRVIEGLLISMLAFDLLWLFIYFFIFIFHLVTGI